MFFRSPSPLAIRVVVVLAVVAGAVALVSAPSSPFTVNDKAYYADQAQVAFVRPGLVIKILSAEIASDGAIKARVRFTDPKGLPLDKDGLQTPGAISNGSPGMIAAYIPKGKTQYVAYTTRPQTSPITNKTAVQARNDTGGVWQQVADGEYVYTFATKAPAGFDKTATHTIGVYGNRNLSEFDLGIDLADAVFHFVPDGSKVTVTRDVIKTATCNKCHENLHLHGETGRRSVEVCVLCHQPQSIDPDTGNTVDMPVMIHKIHMGKDLPSVQAGKHYQIIGNSQSVNDYSDVGFPSDPRSCRTCHESGKGAAQEDAWLKPNQAACGACHDNVNFATGENHVNLPQVSDSQCSTCHTPQGELEFDASIKGAHIVPKESAMLEGIQYEILKVDDGVAGRKPTVTFSLKDKTGKPLQISQMSSLSLVLGGPTTDYTAFDVGYVSESMIGKPSGANGIHTVTLSNAIPANAKGTYAIGIEGRREQKLLEGTKKEMSVRYGGVNKVVYFSVDGSKVVPRRSVVTIAKCNACHTNLSLHGENRNQIEQCVLCHNPVQNDKSVRPAAAGAPESIDFRWMIHRIHRGEELPENFVVYGRGGSKNDFSEVLYPAPLNVCEKCHVNGSQNLPLPAERAQVNTPRDAPTTKGPQAAACLACHASQAAASHAVANTTQLGESCGVCHSTGADFAVGKVHALEVR